MIEATHGPFATAQMSVPTKNGFNGETVYYPTFAQIAGATHLYYLHPNNVEMNLLIPWLKIFLDNDTRYEQFLCPRLPDPSTISIYHPKCPYVPSH